MHKRPASSICGAEVRVIGLERLFLHIAMGSMIYVYVYVYIYIYIHMYIHIEYIYI